MQISIESTDIITEIDGVPVRLWEGTTAGGVPCKVFVHRVAVRDDLDSSQFETELLGMSPPATRPAGLHDPKPISLRSIM